MRYRPFPNSTRMSFWEGRINTNISIKENFLYFATGNDDFDFLLSHLFFDSMTDDNEQWQLW